MDNEAGPSNYGELDPERQRRVDEGLDRARQDWFRLTNDQYDHWAANQEMYLPSRFPPRTAPQPVPKRPRDPERERAAEDALVALFDGRKYPNDETGSPLRQMLRNALDANSETGPLDLADSEMEGPLRELFRNTFDGDSETEPIGLAEDEIIAKKGVGEGLRRFATERYEVYDFSQESDPGEKQNLIDAAAGFAKYDNFKLVLGNAVYKPQEMTLPTVNVRLDDSWVGFVGTVFASISLQANWPAEFSMDGYVRNNRAPLGEPCILEVKPGSMDVHGRRTKRGGLYFGWYRGVYQLCGEEGWKRELYKRPRGRPALCSGIGWKTDDRVPDDYPYNTAPLDANSAIINPRVTQLGNGLPPAIGGRDRR